MYGRLAALWRRWSRRRHFHVLRFSYHEGTDQTFYDVTGVRRVRLFGERYLQVRHRGGEFVTYVPERAVDTVEERIYRRKDVERKRVVHSL